MNKKQQLNKSILGFTLIELITVIGLIGILTSSIVILIDPIAQLKKARDTQRKSDIRQIQSALEMYRADNGSYPASVYNCNTSASFGNVAGSPSCGVIYVNKMPKDPSGGGYNSGNYYYTAPAGTYQLCACLENSKDPQGESGGPAGSFCTNASGCSTNWYYRVDSP